MSQLAYADPPYPGQSLKHYGDHPDYAGEVDHAELLGQLTGYDGWVLHTSSVALRDVLPLCPPEVRVMAWVKPFAAFKRNVSVAYAWEPVIVKAVRKPIVTGRIVMRDWEWTRTEDLGLGERDFIAESITLKKGLSGVKPEKVCRWAFEMVGAEPTDELDDLFPGSGAVQSAWDNWRSEIRLALDPTSPSLPDDDALCSCGHTAHWHGYSGTRQCEHSAECDCKLFAGPQRENSTCIRQGRCDWYSESGHGRCRLVSGHLGDHTFGKIGS